MDILNCTPLQWYDQETHFLEMLNDETTWTKIPLLNVNDLHDLKDSRLVRFQGMIQDMHGPEFYLEKFEVMNEETKKVTTRVGKYIDIASCEPHEIIDGDGSSVVRSERQTYVAISVPAVNTWAYKLEESVYKLTNNPQPSTSCHSQAKRPLDEMETDNSDPLEQSNDNKKQCMQVKNNEASNVVSQEHLLNFPIPDSNGKVCHIKVYQNCDSLKINSVCEFVGFLSVDPSLATHDDDEMNDVEFQVHNPPPSLVPRIHCVSFKPLKHNNPLINESMPSERMPVVRKELLILLTQLLCGDELAAEYFIYNLISEVYLRKELMALGKFSLNISNTPQLENLDYVQELYKFLELMVTKSHYLAMSLENMNELTFVPNSILQLSANTHLVVDETKLTPGKLNEAGVAGVKAIASAIKNQKTMYDFTYYQIEFDCDIPFLIFSEGKSMLPSDVHVVLEPDEMHLNTFSEILQAARHFLKPELLNEIRVYLTSARLLDYNISDDIQELVQNEFVNMRQKGGVSADDLHNLLVLARLVCISEGKHSLDEECWKKACALEETRKNRLKKRP
ncbi:hypothetical protein Zmor_008075 [Zophobas morio]|uniref:Mini-chromosome maintenance complex-binding protein n=1 Tax=Zophobas morio TaxID=2755281 RepID=A0AA38J3L7_9CUCU|nr:hypothetical protein Zmor_008075 [Zophobas morio]